MPLADGIRLAWELLEGPVLRQRFTRFIGWNASVVASSALLRRAVHAYLRPAAHLCGSARMGVSDREAVVDARGRVFGLDNVLVADASVIPSAPCAPTQLTTLAVAETIAAELIRSLD